MLRSHSNRDLLFVVLNFGLEATRPSALRGRVQPKGLRSGDAHAWSSLSEFEAMRIDC